MANDQCFAGFDLEAFLPAASTASNIGDHRLVTKGRFRAVEEALPGVLTHGAGGVLRILLALVFIEEIDDPAHHFATGIVAGWLRNGNDLDLVLGQLALIDAELDAIPKKARQAVNDDGFKGCGLS